MTNEFSAECKEILKLLSLSKNVLISGAPGTGKSRLLAEVAKAFYSGIPTVTNTVPVHDRTGQVPIPAVSQNSDSEIAFPAAGKTKRNIFRTVFHQNSKYREFLSGIVPNVKVEAGNPQQFKIITGTLYKASEFAKAPDSASLLIIDEINRGPAIQIFGGSIVALEADKRLAADGNASLETQYFEILDPSSGEMLEYALPNDLYILAAMNLADASVEPLDVAFLRRWEPFRINPNVDALRSFYKLGTSDTSPLPDNPASKSDVFNASTKAWEKINERVGVGRGTEFEIGHGVLFGSVNIDELDLETALDFVCLGWEKIRSHVEEVFFGDLRGVAATFNALEPPAYSPFKLEEVSFAGELRYRILAPKAFTRDNIYSFFKAVLDSDNA